MKSKQQHWKNKLQRLHCSVKNYDWGQPCSDSLVAKLFSMNSGSQLDQNEPYAEFWMGTHESGPSFLVFDGSERVTLKSWLLENPSVLGQNVLDKWGGDLPFLFKVLSVAKASSIQAHPDKELARTLHKLHPDVYKDGNHKPEMALAVTESEALCGFVTLEELKAVLTIPEIVELVGVENVESILQITDQDGEEKIKPLLKTVFTDLMSASKERVTGVVERLRTRLHKERHVRQLTDKEQLVLRLEKQYPGDVGVIASFFLNHVKLTPGEALFHGANEPHAYICGECIECMATSDNVVRAGLTPKHRDVQTLCSMLTYKQGSPEILRGVPLNPYVNRYLPPFEEFEIDCCILPQGEKVVFPAVPGPSIFLVTVGDGMMNSESLKEHQVTEGDVLFVAANTEIFVISASDLHLYRTGVNSRFFQAS
ncbi:mannose-6-phosphate isomerase 1-like [Gastrolobium bilobum]|uniref:mannose-6-phosphate isomerase 1-like n=1 Tax=Gastrolobium bilobum TaxID=150636 RepID=UPI002AB3055B|nr:mannose-6-phosphate isomerase 1-like [Gastrolobium bilobum]